MGTENITNEKNGEVNNADAGTTKTNPEAAKGNSGDNDGKVSGKANDGGNSDTAKPNVNTDTNPLVGSPEAFEDFTIPDGFVISNEVKSGYREVAKEMNLSQKGAQKLIDLQAKNSKAQFDANQSAFDNMKTEWDTEAKKELGDKHKSMTEASALILKQFGNDNFNTLAKEMGILQHKSFLAFVAKIREAISEDAVETGSAAGGGKKSDAEVMFPTHGK